MRFLVLLLATWTLISRAETVVVVHRSNSVNDMTKSQVIDLFMGRYNAFPNGQRARPIDSQNDSLKRTFYTGLTGMSLARVNAYWSRIKFTGRSRPPVQLKNSKQIADFISVNEEAIGYIKEEHLNSDLKVVYTVDEQK